MIFLVKGLKYNVIIWVIAGLMLLLDAVYYLYSVRTSEITLLRLESGYQAKRSELKTDADGPAKNDSVANVELPKWEDFTKVMGEVYNKADQLDLILDSASYQPSTIKSSHIVKITVSWPVEGSYADIKRFIYYLETSPRTFIIEGLSLGSKKEGEGAVSLKLSVAAYFKG